MEAGLRIGFLTVFGAVAVCLAQTPPAPPPGVEAALRDRVAKFYQAQIDGKYRLAEQYVAEDTKDYYYGKYKTKYLTFAIQKISYAANFSKAKVAVRCERMLSAAMMPSMKVKLQEDSDWKIENGLWCWTYDPSQAQNMLGQTPASGQANPTPDATPIGPADLSQMVSADKKEVRLNERATSDLVVLRNALPGFVTLRLDAPEAPGLEVRIDHEELGPKGTARVFFAYKPNAAAAKEVVVNVSVEPTNQTIPIRVTMEPPALPEN